MMNRFLMFQNKVNYDIGILKYFSQDPRLSMRNGGGGKDEKNQCLS